MNPRLKRLGKPTESVDVSVYEGSLYLAATDDTLDAVFAVEGNALRVTAGDLEIVTCPLDELTVDHRDDGLHLCIEGEDVMVTVRDEGAFADAITRDEPRRRRAAHRRRSSRRPLRSLAGGIGAVFKRENWVRWLQNSTVRWSIASVTVGSVGLMAVFATATLGMVIILLGMLTLVIAALAASDDPSAYRMVPSFLTETTLAAAGFAAIAVGGFLVLIS